ncbi:MAG: methyltransferase domain-containing protein [Ktedonobacteraceae bacterium]|nr:methyltransferase domain-containing protein [Ktedonobacteraceae bacterium]
MEEPVAPGESSHVAALQQALAEELKSKGYLTAPEVEAAFRSVPRHLFLPSIAPEEAYHNKVIHIKTQDGVVVSTSSEPTIMAIMLEQLQLEPGQSVLEIGAGSGYNAALMAYMVGEEGNVVTVDIDDDLVRDARAHLAAAGFERVQVVCGDGGLGYPAAAPYDRIILTARTWDIAPAWYAQLRPGGRLLLPLTILPRALGGPQVSVVFEKTGDHLSSTSIKVCRFLHLRGSFAAPDARVFLSPEHDLWLTIEGRDLVDAEATYRLLHGPYQDIATGLRVTHRDIWHCSLWLSLRESGFCNLITTRITQEQREPFFPPLFSTPGKSSGTLGLLGPASLCVFTCPPDHSYTMGEPVNDLPFDLSIRSFGTNDTLAQHLIEQIHAWQASGQPPAQPFPGGLSIHAYPLENTYVAAAHEIVILKRWTRLVIDWQ